MQQTTLSREITLSGHGVHTNQAVQMTLKPAEPGSGRVFVRTDLPGHPEISAHIDHLDASIMMSTALQQQGVQVRTTEHVLAALSALQVDNVRIELTAVECPILDGSALPFVESILAAGLVTQSSRAEKLVILQEVRVELGSAWACLLPHAGFRIEATYQFEHPAIQPTQQAIVFDQDGDHFEQAIAAARTFGFLADYERAKQAGYALGSSLENTIVFDESAMLNAEALRYDDECARHKCLDVIGDLALLGHRIQGMYKGFCSGHALTAQLMQVLLQNEEAWCLQVV